MVSFTIEQLLRQTIMKMPFNVFLGLKILSIEGDGIRVAFDMKNDFVGNYLKGPTLHGGIIASVLDITGGISASFNVLKTSGHLSQENIEAILSRSGTIDLRVDYLRPGVGTSFQATASILRLGKRITVTRMALRNDQDVLIAVGTGTYLIA